MLFIAVYRSLQIISSNDIRQIVHDHKTFSSVDTSKRYQN